MAAEKVADNSGLKQKNRLRQVRMAVLILVLTVSTVLGLMHQFVPSGGPVGVDALCPFGGLESAFTLIFTGAMIKRVALSSFILLIVTIVLALVFRRSFCGVICPLGTIQELAANLGKKLFKRQVLMPAAIDRPARLLKYLALVLVVFFSAKAGELVIRPYDPWVAYHHLTSSEVFTDFLVGLIVLAITLVGSFFYNRVFCKYLCPMGAFLAPLSKAGWFTISRDPAACIRCGACNQACPVQLEVMDSSRIDSAECISCYECLNVCPGKGALSLSGRLTGAIPVKKALGAVVLIFVMLTAATTATGDFLWQTETLASQVEAAGTFDSGLIKGSMSLAEVVDGFGIPTEVLQDKYKVTDEDLKLPMKNIKEKYAFETEDVRAFVAEYLQNSKTGGK